MIIRQLRAFSKYALFLAGLLVLQGCSGDDPIPEGRVEHIRAFFGGVGADEPNAALIGRDVLSAGGSAVDAVTAMAFAMMVTRPDAAGAGGGGVCVVYDPEKKEANAIEFLPHPSRSRPPANRWIASAPGSFRGLFVLHARYGKLRWEQVVFPAERLARFGVEVPKALANALDRDGKVLLNDPATRAVFTAGSDKLMKVRDKFEIPDIARIFGQVRGVGPGDFYEGRLADEYVRAVAAMGGWLTKEDMRNYRPRWLKPDTQKFGNHLIHFSPSPALGGQMASRLWKDMGNRSAFASGNEQVRLGYVANIAHRAFADPNLGSSAGRGSAGMFAMDRLGGAASCVMTMNKPFGVGALAGATGIIPTPPADLGATLSIAPVVMSNEFTNQGYMAGTGSGDRFAALSLVSVLLWVQNNPRPNMRAAINASRLAPYDGRRTFAEGTENDAVAAIRATGRQPIRAEQGLSSVNAMYCTDGVRRSPRSCVIAADPRSGAYAVTAEGS